MYLKKLIKVSIFKTKEIAILKNLIYIFNKIIIII